MLKIASYTDISKIKDLTFEFTNTLRNEPVDKNSLSADFVIDVNGLVYKNGQPKGSAKVIIVGGLSTFTNEKYPREPTEFLTIQQQQTLSNAMRRLGTMHKYPSINSSNRALSNFLNQIHYNSKF